ncbi:Rhodanese-like domain-containing protein [Zostera marina]|uniref:Rhodanese-like domain-containing protein n=1 Tax=Zostera marina TaxID=29655 RepID=A0A0K9Q4G5_ZOSMR|nr:Rhodanese-like domain-containing protein [Zostera marina]
MSDDVGVQVDKVNVVPNSVHVRVAHDLLLAGHRYLDVRTPEEFNRGHPIGAVNIPYMYKTSAGMTKNPDFVKDVKSIFGEDTELIVGCQMGKRSQMAATHLSSSGFTAITDNTGGYSAWMENGFPTQ